MRFVCSGVAVLAVVCSAAAVAAPAVKSARATVATPPAHAFASAPRPRGPAGFPVPETCATSNPSSFVAISGDSNVAGGLHSAVLGGQSNEACDFDSAIGSGESNDIGYEGSAFWNFIGSGTFNAILGENSFIGSGTNNLSEAFYSFVGSGTFNAAEGAGSFVGGGDYVYYARTGFGNAAAYGNIASGPDSFVGAGDLNQASGNGSFIGGGGYDYANRGATTAGNQVSGLDSFLGAGDKNAVSGNQSFLGGGVSNTLSGTEGVLGGGYANNVGASGTFSTIAGGNANGATNSYEAIGGGFDNVAAGTGATIPGGERNEANAQMSFAAGYQAHALNTGSFVWSDFVAGASPVSDTGVDQFVVRASGGTFVYSNEAATAGVQLSPGSGSWSSLSDRNAKTDIVPLDDASILAKVAALPVSAWRYKSETSVRHVGPMAQDFYAAFRVGEDARHITSIDEDGVALAAIKALHAENDALRERLTRSDARAARSDARLADLERKVEALSRR